MLKKRVKINSRAWSKLLSMFLILFMMAGLVGAIGTNTAFAQATTSMVIKVTGPTGVVETDTVTAAMINALPSSSASTGVYFLYSYRDSGNFMRYFIGSGAPTADILSYYTSITAADVVSAKLFDDSTPPYEADLTDTQLVSTSTGTLDYFPNFTTPGQPIPSIIATASYGDRGTTTTPPALPTASEMDGAKCLRNFYGQTSLTDAEASNSDQNIAEIDITSLVDPVTVTGITLNKTTDAIAYGNTDTLLPIFTPSNATNQTVTWSSDNTAVATVSSTGVVTPVALGTANITATTAYGGFHYTCAVTVTGGPTASMVIKVNGGAPVTVTDAQILALNPTNTLSYYSANGSRTFTCLGAPLTQILSNYASLTSSEAQDVSATFIGSDNYTVTIPESTLLQTRYYYPSDGSAAVQVPPIIATAEADNLITTDPTQLSPSACLRNFIGQANATDHISNLLDQNIKEIDVTYDPAPILAATAAPGSASGATAVTATPSVGSDHLAYLVSASSIPTPNVGDSLPSGATNSYTSGSDISGVDVTTNKYVGVYELNVANQVVEFAQIILTGSQINTATPVTGAPVVSSINPSTGPADGGSAVTITGANLSVVSAVHFGSVPATGLTTTTSGTSLAVVSPPGTGTVDVAVYSTVYGLSSTFAPFTYYSQSTGGGGGGSSVVYTPTIQTEAATSVTTDSAVLNGAITSDNGYDITDYGFLWGTSSTSLTNKLAAGANNHSGAFTATLSSLTTGTMYYFRAYATNSHGTADGAVLSFTTTGTGSSQTTTPPPPVPAPVFSDVSTSYWGYDAISSLSSRDIVSGYPDGTFKPDASITRAEFATMLVKALGLSTTGTTGKFTDVTADSWYYGSVNAAASAGLVSGMGDNLFAPTALITREQMAVMVTKALGNKAPAVDGTELNVFSDRSAVSSWAVSGMEEAIKAGIVSGMTADTLAPMDNATRAQAAAMIYKMLIVLGK